MTGIGEGHSLAELSNLVGPLEPNADAQTATMRRLINTHAHDTDDARLLRSALGMEEL